MMEIEERIKELFESGKTKPYQIAKELQIPRQEVRGYLRKRDKPKKSEKKEWHHKRGYDILLT